MAKFDQSRRSFFVEALTRIAGGWLALAGLLGLGRGLAGCIPEPVKYGGPPVPPPGAADSGRPPAPPETPDSGRPVTTKYGGPGLDPGAVPKYGAPAPDDLPPDPEPTKYGGPPGERPKAVKYGGPSR